MKGGFLSKPVEQVNADNQLESAERDLERARVLREQGKFAEALPLFERASVPMRKYGGLGKSLETLEQLGMCAYRAGRLGRAAEALRETAEGLRGAGLEDNAETARVVMNLGLVLVEQGKYGEAVPALERSLTILDRIKVGPGSETYANTVKMLRYARAELDKDL